MKAYTHVTPSHRPFLEEFFLPTASKEFEVVVCEGAQVGSPDYGTAGFERSMTEKARSMLRAAQEPVGSVVLWSDVDVQFFRPCAERVIECLGPADIAFQSKGSLCAGLFAFRVSDATRKFFQQILDVMVSGEFLDDECAINRIIHSTEIKWRRLPWEEFWNVGFCGMIWNGDPEVLKSQVTIPKDIRVHHGNYCIGIQRKLELMRYVKAEVEKA